jgi:hypothetical protein
MTEQVLASTTYEDTARSFLDALSRMVAAAPVDPSEICIEFDQILASDSRTIQLVKEKLTDGSHVYNIVVLG